MKMATLFKTRVKVGKIRYINCLPFYHGLFTQMNFREDEPSAPVEFYEAYPTQINLALRKGKVDIAPISSLEYLNHQKDYLLLPDLIIGARDFSRSVLLISREKVEALDGAKIALSRQSLSSVSLLRILLKFKYKFENSFVVSNAPPSEMLKSHQAALIIGDDALFYQPKEFVYKYDLSELWWNWTEKPFCFAVWAVRRAFAKTHADDVRTFYRVLKKNVERNLADMETLLKDGLQLSFVDERFPHIFGYLFNLNYGFDPAMREGLELFYRLAHRLGISPHPEKIDFFDIK